MMSENTRLTKDQILRVERSRKGEWFHVPEWGGDVFVKCLSSIEADHWKQRAFDARRSDGRVSVRRLEAELVSLCVCESEEGKPMLTAGEAGGLSNQVVTRLFQKSLRLNGLSGDDEAMREEIEARGKSSGGTGGEGIG